MESLVKQPEKLVKDQRIGTVHLSLYVALLPIEGLDVLYGVKGVGSLGSEEEVGAGEKLLTNIETIFVKLGHILYLLAMAKGQENTQRRVILAYWKDREEDRFEVFTNLLLFCKSYPAYSYNTLNNYLSKRRIAFENEVIRIERKKLNNRPILAKPVGQDAFRLVRVVRKAHFPVMDEKQEDLNYWLSRPQEERIAAVTFLVWQSLRPGSRMDRSFMKKRKLRDHDTE